MTIEVEGRTDLPFLEEVGELAALVHDVGEVFVRFSAGPAADLLNPWWDTVSESLLPGLPVQPLQPPDWWRLSTRLWVARQICHRPSAVPQGWVLTGAVVSHGVDCEPLVACVRALALLSPGLVDEAETIYAAWRLRDVV